MLHRARRDGVARSSGVLHQGCSRFARPERLRSARGLRQQLQAKLIDSVRSSDKPRSQTLLTTDRADIVDVSQIGISRRKGDHFGAEIHADQRSHNEGCSDQGSRKPSAHAIDLKRAA